MRRTKKALSLFLTVAMVLAMFPAITLTFTEKPKAYSTFTKNWSTEYYYPAGTRFVKNIYVAWWGSGNADKMAGIVGASGDYYIEDGYHTRHYNNHSGAVWDKDLNRGCGSSSDDVYIGYDFTTDPAAANACKGIRYDHNGSAPSTMTSSGVTWWKCNTGDNATYAPSKGPDGAADLNKGCGSSSDDIKIYATYDRSFGPAVSILSITDTDDNEPGSRSGGGWSDATTFQNTGYCLDLNKGVSGSHDLFTHYYTPCVVVDSNSLRSAYANLLVRYNRIDDFTYINGASKATVESALNTAQSILSDLADGYTTSNQTAITNAANACNTAYNNMLYKITYNLNGGSASGNPTGYNESTAPVKLNNPTKLGYTFTGWTGSNGTTPQTDVRVPNVVSSGINYTTASPYTASGRDHVFGNSFPVVSGQVYRVFVTAKRTAGSLNMNGGIWYAAGQTGGSSWDGVSGAFTYLKDAGNGWGVYYKDVTVPNNKQRGQFYMQIDQAGSGGTTTWQLADCYVTATGTSFPLGLDSYKTTSPYTCSLRDHGIGNSFPVVSGKTYRVYVTAKRTAGTLGLNGGIQYTAQTEGNAWDGLGAFTYSSDCGDGWGRYYRDVTVPAGKTAGRAYFQIDQSHSGVEGNVWQVADVAVVDRTLPALSYTANWTPTNHNITYNLNGGTVSGNPTSYNVETLPVKLNNPAKTGYTFTGWTGSNGSTPSTDVSVANVVSSGINYTKASPYTASSRDHFFGNEFQVLPGMTYRVYVTAKRTAGTLNMNGGIWYTSLKSGAAYDGVGGAFTYLKDAGDGWGVYYKDVTVPAGKLGGKFYVQLEQYSPYGTTWQLADCYVTTRFSSLPINLGQYTLSNPLTCSGRDHRPGSQVSLIAGKTYRVYVTAKRTAGSRGLNGGLWYNTNASGYGYDGYGAFTLQTSFDDGWGIYYRDVTVPAGKNNATVFIQIDQSDSTGYDTTWQCANMAIAYTDFPDLAYTANWQVNTYNLSYNLNGGAVATANPATYTVESNAITLNNPTKTGYTFKGWSGTGLSGDANNPVTVAKGSTGDRSYTANWTKNTYSVKFNGNGATAGSMGNQPFEYDVEKALTENAYVRAYNVTYKNNNGAADGSATATASFNGWATTATGAKVYNDKHSVKNLTANNGAVIELFANWTLGSVTLPTPTRTGYIFKGWFRDSDLTQSVGLGGASFTPTENTTLYAKWEAESYNVTYTLGEGAATANAPLAIAYGETASFTVTLDEAHDQTIPTVTATGANVSQTVSGNVVTVTLSGATGAVTVNVPTVKNTYTLTIKGDEGFTSEDQAKTAEYGDTLVFTVTLSEGYTQNAPVVTKDGAALTPKSVEGNAYTYEIENVTSDITVSVAATKNTYTATLTAEDHGTVNAPATPVTHGESYTFTVTPAVGYTQKPPTVTVNGAALSAANIENGVYTYIIDSVTAAPVIDVRFTLNSYEIAYTADEGAAVNGVESVDHGGELSFTVTLNEGYTQTAPVVTVNGAALAAASNEGSVYTYTLTNVTENKAVNVTTTKNVYEITLADHTGADVSFETATVTHGADFTFTVEAQTGYDQTAPVVTVNSEPLAATGEEDGVYTYVIPAVTGEKTVAVAMEKNVYTVSLTADEGASVDPAGEQTVTHGEDFAFTVTLNEGYDQTAPTVTANGEALTAESNEGNVYSYKIENVTAAQTVTVATEKNVYAVTLPSAEGVEIEPAGTLQIAHGEDVTFTVTVTEGYDQAPPTVNVNGETLSANSVDGNAYTYTIENVTGPKNVTVSATKNTYAVTLTADAGATLDPATTEPVAHGEDFSFTVTLNEGYTNTAPAVTVNGAALEAESTDGAAYSYKVSNITEAKAIAVTTTQNTYRVTLEGDDGATIETTDTMLVPHGGLFRFTVTPTDGYSQSAPTVLVNGEPLAAEASENGVYSYRIEPVTNDLAIRVAVSRNGYPIAFTVGEGAAVSPAGTQTVLHGDDLHFTVTLAEGYDRTAPAVTVNGEALAALTADNGVYAYKIANVTEAKTVDVQTTLNTYTAALSGDAGAAITADTETVAHGGNFSFTVTLSEGYDRIAPAVTVNGEALIAKSNDGNVYSYEVENVTDDLTIAAASTLNEYAVTLTADDGADISPAEAQTVAHGSEFTFTVTPKTGYDRTAPVVTVNGETLAAESAVEGVYAYRIATVTDDLTIAAATTLNAYTVIWANWDGEALETDENVPHGTTPVYDGETPEKASTAEFTYSFIGWDKEIAEATDDATYTAMFDNITNSYTVKFVNDDGEVLQEETLLYGATPEYKGATPEKAPTAQFTYTFAGWDQPIAKVTGDMTYTAAFDAEVNQYDIIFKNEDGTPIVTYTLDYGALPVYKGPALAKNSDEQQHYSFAGWTPAVDAVTGNAAYTAVFTAEDHRWNAGAVKTPATCVAAGERIFTCTVCGETRIDSIAIDPANHAGPTEVRGYVAATADAHGYSGDTYCAACDTLLSTGSRIHRTKGACPYCGGYHEGVWGSVVTAVHGILWTFRQLFRIGK